MQSGGWGKPWPPQLKDKTMILSTKVGAYQNLVVSAAGNEAQLSTGNNTNYNPGLPAPGTTALAPKDLTALWSNGLSETQCNGVVLVCYATASEDNTCEMEIYGIADGKDAAPERIADVVWIFGTAQHTSTTVLWADTCTVTADYHPPGVTVADSGNNIIAKLTFDTFGYRYLYAVAYGTATGEATNITVLMRPY